MDALVRPETVGTDAVKLALSRLRTSSDGVYFAIRFHPNGQRLRREAGKFLSGHVNSSLLSLRLARLFQDAAQTAATRPADLGAWAALYKQSAEIRTMSSGCSENLEPDLVRLGNIFDKAFADCLSATFDQVDGLLFESFPELPDVDVGKAAAGLQRYDMEVWEPSVSVHLCFLRRCWTSPVCLYVTRQRSAVAQQD